MVRRALAFLRQRRGCVGERRLTARNTAMEKIFELPISFTMMPLVARSTLVRSAATVAARRQMSTAPKMHKASDKWSAVVKSRPHKDHLDEHVSWTDGRQSDIITTRFLTPSSIVRSSWSFTLLTMALLWLWLLRLHG